jgi:glycosyltransferase involved in cell wall biosynthesis
VKRLAVVVLHEPSPGGGTNTVLRALPGLEQAGWRFHFWAPVPGATAALLRAQGYPVDGRPRPIRYSWSALAEPPGPWRRLRAVPGYLAEFRHFLARTGPDLVHANTILTLPEALVARAAGIATLLHIHEMLPDDVRGFGAARLAKLVDWTAADSQACAGRLRGRGVPVGIVTAGVEAPARAPRAPRAGPLVVGMLATVSRRKGTDVFVAAASAILGERSDVEFRLVGPLAPGEQAWGREVVARAEHAGVRWSQWCEVADELRDWDLFVLPTRQDPFPLVVLDAMAAGLPVIASRVDGVPEQVDGASAVLVPVGDAKATRAAITALLDDGARRAAMGRAGAARTAAHFTPERHARELLAAYAQAIARSRSRRSARRRARVPAEDALAP